MKLAKLGGLAVSAALVLTTLTGVAPASAVAVQLPPNANGVDNSGFEIFSCETSLFVTFPITPSSVHDLEWQAEYYDLTWFLDDNQEDFGDTRQYGSKYSDFSRVGNKHKLDYVTSKTPGATFTLSLKAGFYDFNISEYIKSDPIDISVTVQDSDAFAGGSGTKNDPFLIANAAQMNLVRCHSDKYFKLTSNIDMAGTNWLPIGSENHAWQGNFDGNGKTISNLEIDSDSGSVGLFGEVKKSSISNLTIKDAVLKGFNLVAPVAGGGRYSSFDNIKVINADITANRQASLFMGRYDYRGNFTNISVDGKITVFQEVRFSSVWNPGYVEMRGPQDIGGVIGYDDADGTNWYDIKSNVVINSRKLTSEEIAVFENADEPSTSSLYDFGGFGGEFGEQASASKLNLKTKMNLDFGFGVDISQLGGVFGTVEESLFENIVSDFELNISGNNSLYNIGGFSGESDSASFKSINSTANMNFEVGCRFDNYDDCPNSNKVGGFVSNSGDSAYFDIRSNAKMNFVFVDEAHIYDVGGFVAYDDETNFQKIISNSEINLVRATPSNNSMNVDGANFALAGATSVGGFAGERDDYSAYRAISSTSSIATDLPVVEEIGGFTGYNSDGDNFPLTDVIIRGAVSVPSSAAYVGGFAGKSGNVNLRRVILSVNLASNGATDFVNQFIGGYYNSEETAKAESRFNDMFINSDVMDVQEGFPASAKPGKTLKSAKFLKAHGFDLTNIYKHKEGQFPVVKLNTPFTTETGSNLKAGQSNGDTSISFGKLLSGGSRNYFVNLRNVDARKVADLVVFRAGKVVKTVASSVTNGVGNYAATSKFKLKVGDVLQVRIGSKVISKLLVK